VARQKLGQHFLANGKTLQQIATAAREGSSGPASGLAVEIGPGKGALTQHLLAQFERVVAVELDPVLAQHVRERWQNEPRLEVVQRDALDADWRAWGAGVLVGNLPYYVSTVIISNYVRDPGTLAPATFLIQKEVAERITATPGHREYGYLSIECQLLAATEYLFDVPPGAFKPPPKVDSAVIRLKPLSPPEGLDVKRFLSFASACFRQKRKTLRNNLSERYPRATLDLRPEMGKRAEQLSVAQLLDLYRALNPDGEIAPVAHPSI
jgi:16S rRNA (adenine1518-N6/adenine1519-N6)-dimethyltransferase